MTWFMILLVAQVASDAASVPAPPASPSSLEIGGLITFGTGFVTVLGTQFIKPWLEAYYADKRHKREMDALDMANDLKLANERNTLLMKQITLLQEQVAMLTAEVAAIRLHWKDETPPPASSSGIIATSIAPPYPAIRPGGGAK